MRVVFLAPLVLAGCAEVSTAPVQNPIPAPAPVATTPAPPPPAAEPSAPARSETRSSPPAKPKPLPESVVNAVNNSSSPSENEGQEELAAAEPPTNTCKEGSWWGLIGRPKSAASIVSEPKRVYTEGDPVTMDANPDRTNIVLDAEGKIAKVTCG
ncbi:I78 family peptidase inhibitor [Sulfitobacter sp. 1A12157]|uniref:I78 family peptidase inhibitor n=1 Tax=Sulfitobacter sp. 1A12157 TaxID=3368594 RepID=UPI003744FC94